jgi:hypothetical protein
VKLRIHTDHTIAILDQLTTTLGQQLRDFVEYTCSEISTKELRREYDARKRRLAKKKGTRKVSKAQANQKGKGVVRNKGMEKDTEEDVEGDKTQGLKAGPDGEFLIHPHVEAEPTQLPRWRTSRKDTEPKHTQAACAWPCGF